MSARRAAADLVVAVLDEGRALDVSLAQTPSFAALEGRDRAFARALATATLRRLGGIDAVLAHFLDRPLPETAAHGRALLRIGAAQMLILGTPAHAAVGETVATANDMREGRGFAKLINAVLRRVSERGAEMLAAQPPGADLPAWLITRWRAAYGAETAAAIALALHDEPPLDLSVKAHATHWAARLGGQVLPTGSIRLPPGVPVDQLDGFESGSWWVQDAAAAMPVRLLGDVEGKNVLDLCAAPGGKTLQLAAAGAYVTAVDRSAERLERVRENLARTKLSAKIVRADALTLNIREPFDAILLDAPCTATGTLRRHPDAAWLRRPDDVRTLTKLQSDLLAKTASFVKPGGRVVYVVCSLEPEEGPGVIAQALETGFWTRAPLVANEAPAEFITPEGDLRTLPSHWPERGGLDGFFAARLVRT